MKKYSGVIQRKDGTWAYKIKKKVDGKVVNIRVKEDKFGFPFLTAKAACKARIKHEIRHAMKGYGWIAILILAVSALTVLSDPFRLHEKDIEWSAEGSLYEAQKRADAALDNESDDSGMIEADEAAVQSGDGLIKAENAPLVWKKGGYTGTGSFYKSSNTMVTEDYVPEDAHLIYAENNFVFYPVVYDTNDNYLGFWDGSDIVQSATKTVFYINAEGLAPNKLKLMVRKNDETEISAEECSSNIHFLNRASAKNFAAGPTLTFIDDDGSKEALENWESICDELGINITSALVTNSVGVGGHASWEDVERLQSKGFEFVSHTHNHINLTTTSAEKIETELSETIKALKEHGCEYRYLVYPYNAINTDLMPLVGRYFEAGVGLGSGKTDNSLPIYTYHIRRYSINDSSITVEKEYNGEIVSAASFKTLDTLKNYIDDAVVNNGWMIIMTHLRNDENFYFDDAMRSNIVELCNYAVERGVEIKTFGEAFDDFRNRSEEGVIYDANYEIVDCNGVLHYRK